MRAFLRHGRDLVEIDAPVIVGRSSRCHIVLGDELTSREHCRFERVAGAVVVIDLDSRNGISVNGARVDGRAELHHGDVVTVGGSHLVLLRQADAPRGDRGSQLETRPRRDLGGLASSAFAGFATAAEAALARGDDLAARSHARSLLAGLDEVARSSGELDEGLVGAGAALALTLAERGGDVFWLEQLLSLHLVTGRAMRPEIAARLASAAAHTGTPGPILDDYLAAARRMPSFSPAARTALEGLLATTR